MRPFASRTRLALIALSFCTMAGGSFAHADAPADSLVPPGWVWQGVWQDGRWSGQWIPGPGPMPGAPQPGAWQQQPVPDHADPGAMLMADRCHAHRHDDASRDHDGWHRPHSDCAAMPDDGMQPDPGYPGSAPGYGAMPYGPMPYTPMAYAPMGYMVVPIVTAPQAPCVETRTVTTEYVVDRRRRVLRAAPHRKEKRVYTGS